MVLSYINTAQHVLSSSCPNSAELGSGRPVSCTDVAIIITMLNTTSRSRCNARMEVNCDAVVTAPSTISAAAVNWISTMNKRNQVGNTATTNVGVRVPRGECLHAACRCWRVGVLANRSMTQGLIAHPTADTHGSPARICTALLEASRVFATTHLFLTRVPIANCMSVEQARVRARPVS